MLTFGFSAYLKVICLRPRPRRRALVQRLGPSTGGYDFHRQMRALISQLAAGAPLDEVLALAAAITSPSERAYAERAVQRFAAWASHRRVSGAVRAGVTYQSPSGLFSVGFRPQFVLNDASGVIPVHVWNTKAPELVDILVMSALHLAYAEYEREGADIGNVGVLSIPEGRLRVISDFRNAEALAARVVANIETAIEDLNGRVGEPDDPRAPPPSRR